MVEYLLMYEQWCRTSYTSQYLASGLHLSATNNNVCSFHLRENGLITSRVMLPSSACFRTLLISIIISTLFPSASPHPPSIFIFFPFSKHRRCPSSNKLLFTLRANILSPLFFLFFVNSHEKKKKKKTKNFFTFNNNYPRVPLDQSSSSSKNHWFFIVSRATSRFVQGTLNAICRYCKKERERERIFSKK